MNNTKDFLINNTIAFFLVFSTSSLMLFGSDFEVEVGSYLYLPIGAKILAFLLFGRQVLPGVIVACLFCGVVLFDAWGGHYIDGALGAVLGALAPLAAMWILDKSEVTNFKNLTNINFRHVLFLIFFTSVIHALSRFMLYAKSEVFSINPIDFLIHYLVGDMLGGIVVIWIVLKFLPYVVAILYRKI